MKTDRQRESRHSVHFRRWAAIFSALAVFIILQAGCGGGGGSMREPAISLTGGGGPYLSGKVLDNDGVAVTGALVTIPDSGLSATTGSDGSFSIAISPVTSDGIAVKLAASKSGYITLFKTIHIYPDNLNDGVAEVSLNIAAEPRSSDAAGNAEVVDAAGNATQVDPQAVTTDGVTTYETTVDISSDTRSVTFNSGGEVGDAPGASLTIGSADGSGANASTVLGATGRVTGSISYFNPTDQNALTNSTGAPITQFADGQSAVITMYIPSDVANPETGETVHTRVRLQRDNRRMDCRKQYKWDSQTCDSAAG